MKTSLSFQFYRKYFTAVVVTGFFLLGGYFFARYFTISPRQQAPEELAFAALSSEAPATKTLSEFDPNSLTAVEWQELGFSERQTTTILKYKKIVGGTFTSKEQLRKCYAISDEKYRELESFLLLPENGEAKSGRYSFSTYSPSKSSSTSTSFSRHSKGLSVSGKFNPDHYQMNDWVRLGFSERQAAAILKYKNYLGGSFRSKEKFRECFVVSDDHYRQLSPHLLLPETATELSRKTFTHQAEKKTVHYSIFNPNDLDAEGWMKLGFSEKQASVILNYKSKILRGSFKSPEDLANCFVVSETKYAELKPFIRIGSVTASENVPERKSAEVVPVTDFSKTDLNKITFQQLKDFGFDEKSAAGFLGFRKKLGGFAEKKQILETYHIDQDLASKIMTTAILDASQIRRYRLADAPESWLKEHPYFRYYADRIIFYRITYTDDKKIFKLLKAKPGDEAKMRMYLIL